MEDKKLLSPGDIGYLGGVTHTTVYLNGKVQDVRTERDQNGNIVSVITSPKIFGIF